MSPALLFLMLLSPPAPASVDEQVNQLLAAIAKSGRVLESAVDRERLTDPRREVAPGAPPLLAFRYYQGADRHRFGKLDLMLDDAGH